MGQIGKIIDGKFVPFADLGGGKTILTPNKAVVSGADGTLQASEVTAQDVGFLSGLTGNVQEQINEQNQQTLKYRDFFIENIEVKSGNYASYATPDNMNILFATAFDWNVSTNAFTVVAGGKNIYICAPNGTTVKNISLRLWYLQNLNE